MKQFYYLLTLMTIASAGGCAAPTQTYTIAVTNRLSQPITIWLTKAQEPYPDGWTPPEMLAVVNMAPTAPQEVVLQPGESGGTMVSGPMEKGNTAILRVYAADNFNSILAIGRDSPDRADIPLPPGRTDIDIVRKYSQLTFEPHVKMPSTQPGTP